MTILCSLCENSLSYKLRSCTFLNVYFNEILKKNNLNILNANILENWQVKKRKSGLSENKQDRIMKVLIILCSNMK